MFNYVHTYGLGLGTFVFLLVGISGTVFAEDETETNVQQKEIRVIIDNPLIPPTETPEEPEETEEIEQETETQTTGNGGWGGRGKYEYTNDPAPGTNDYQRLIELISQAIVVEELTRQIFVEDETIDLDQTTSQATVVREREFVNQGTAEVTALDQAVLDVYNRNEFDISVTTTANVYQPNQQIDLDFGITTKSRVGVDLKEAVVGMYAVVTNKQNDTQQVQELYVKEQSGGLLQAEKLTTLSVGDGTMSFSVPFTVPGTLGDYETRIVMTLDPSVLAEQDGYDGYEVQVISPVIDMSVQAPQATNSQRSRIQTVVWTAGVALGELLETVFNVVYSLWYRLLYFIDF